MVKLRLVAVGTQQADFLPQRFAFRVAGDFAEGRIDRQNDAVRIRDQDAFRRVMKHAGGEAQCLLGGLLLGDVLQHQQQMRLASAGKAGQLTTHPNVAAEAGQVANLVCLPCAADQHTFRRLRQY